MRLTKEVDYALRIVSMLAKRARQVEARQISAKNDIPYRFTLKILRKLVQCGIIKSSRGVNGGYYLAVPPEEVTLKDIIEIFDGPIAINHCIEEPRICRETEVCPIRRKLVDAQMKFIKELENVNFSEIAHERREDMANEV